MLGNVYRLRRCHHHHYHYHRHHNYILRKSSAPWSYVRKNDSIIWTIQTAIAVPFTQPDRRLKNVVRLYGIPQFYVYVFCYFSMWLVAHIVHDRQDRLFLLYPDDKGNTFSRKLVTFYQSTRCHIQEHRNLHYFCFFRLDTWHDRTSFKLLLLLLLLLLLILILLRFSWFSKSAHRWPSTSDSLFW